MKKLIAFLFVTVVAFSLQSCSKEQIQQKEQDIAVSIMTSGSWIITKFSEGPNDITASFSAWECRFYTDKTCEAINGSTKVAGTWNASTSSKTITGQFPAGSDPLPKINGTWSIVRTTAAFGEFTQTKNGIDYSMELTKK